MSVSTFCCPFFHTWFQDASAAALSVSNQLAGHCHTLGAAAGAKHSHTHVHLPGAHACQEPMPARTSQAFASFDLLQLHWKSASLEPPSLDLVPYGKACCFMVSEQHSKPIICLIVATH